MGRDKQPLSDCLAHILEAIERIDRYTKGMGESAFLGASIVQDAVVRNFEIIGEASNNVEKHPEFAVVRQELPLAFACQIRNAVAHGYLKVDLEIVWKTINSDLPGLRRQVQQALENLVHVDADSSKEQFAIKI